MKYQGIIFDVDGTLVDSNDAHAHAFEEALHVPFLQVRPLIGMGADKLIPALVGRYDAALAERKKEIFKQKYLPHLRPFPGVRTLFQKLRARGAKLAVASSAGKDELGALLEVAGVRDCLEEETDADDAERSKPDPDIVRAALAKLRTPARDCLMVGDTPYDAEAAARAGLAFIGLRCGGWDERALQPAVRCVADPGELAHRIDDLL